MAQSLKALTLFPGEQPTTLQPSAVAGKQDRLWIAICLTEGLTEGLTAQEQLESLAVWSDRLTPLVSLVPPDSLLLEVRGSLKLFGGLKSIENRLIEEIGSRHLPFHLCAAPTALGALWLARNEGMDVLSVDSLAGCLTPFPLTVTRWPDAVQALLSEMGVRTIGDCLRLPRDGFARRVGEHYLADLDKAFGKQADLRVSFESPRSLSWKIDFVNESEDLAVLTAAIEGLIERMVCSLRSYQRQTQKVEIFFHHMDLPPTVNDLQLVEPAYEKHRFLHPLVARLECIDLPAPATAVGLRIDALEAMEAREAGLFEAWHKTGHERVSGAVLIERLRGRFGVEGVYGFELVAEHRPELVWIKLTDRLLKTASAGQLSPWAHDRPLWILPSPLPLPHGISKLRYRGPLQVKSEPERIESGWWDDGDIRRDYYMATTTQGERLWVYRDGVTGDWHLHGIFG